MKIHSLILGAIACVFAAPLFTFADAENITLAPGWSIVSTPKVVEFHSFSADETSDNFDIYVLDASQTSGWATMATLAQTEFTPLWGYFVNNKTGTTQTLTFNYTSDLEPNQKLFERSFSTPGWYSIGVANATYAKGAQSLAADSDNPSRILSLLAGAYDLVIDFTDAVFASDRASVSLSDPWKAAGPSDVDSLNDFRETKGYVVYIKDAGATYNGFQTEGAESETVALIMSEGAGNPGVGDVAVSESNSSEVTLAEFTLKAEGADIVFDELIATTTLTGVDEVGDMVQTYFLLRGSTPIAEFTPTGGMSTTSGTITFELDEQEYLATDGTATYRIVAEVSAIGGGTGDDTAFDQGDAIQLQSLAPLAGVINAMPAGGGEVTERTGSATTYTQTLFSEGIMITKIEESFTHNLQETSASSTGEFKVTLRVTAFGSEDVFIPLSAAAVTGVDLGRTEGVVFGMQNGGTASNASVASGVTATLVRISGGTELTNSVRISAGQSADLQLTVVFDPQSGGTQGWRVQVWNVGSAAIDSASATAQTLTVPVEEFRSQYYTVNN